MSFETAPLRGVSAQYGARKVGGFQGVKKTAGLTYEAIVNFDGDKLPEEVIVPAGALVTAMKDFFAFPVVNSAKVGLVEVKDADGSIATAVSVPLGGTLNITGPTSGSVIVEYEYTASREA